MLSFCSANDSLGKKTRTISLMLSFCSANDSLGKKPERPHRYLYMCIESILSEDKIVMLTLRISKNEYATLFHGIQNGCTIPDFVKKWNEVKSLILSKAFENRDAISIIQLVDEDYFDAVGYEKKEIIDKDTKYLILSSTTWRSDILKDMMNYMEFELAKQWFIERKAEENVNETIKLVNDLQFTIENDTKLELFGCVEDGKEIVWLNPNFEYQSKVFEALNRLENVTIVFE